MNKKYIKSDLENLSCDWRLRSAYSYNSYSVGGVNYDVIVGYNLANYSYGVVPACLII